MRKNRSFSGLTALALAGALVLAVAGPAAAASQWYRYYQKSGGVDIVDAVGDCHYTYGNIIPGSQSSSLGWGWTIDSGGCDAVRARTFYHDANWAGWTSWVTSASWKADSPKRPYSVWTGHQVKNDLG